MVASARDIPRTVLLILPSTKELYPLSNVAFTQAQASRRELRVKYTDALILDVDGSLRHIEHIEVLRPLGQSFLLRLINGFLNAWQINVHLSEPLSMNIDELKKLLIICICSPISAESMGVLTPDELQCFKAAVTAITDFREVLTTLKLPKPENALDVL